MPYTKNNEITPNEYQDQIIKISKHYPNSGTDRALPAYSHGMFEECGGVAGLLKGSTMAIQHHSHSLKFRGKVRRHDSLFGFS